MKSPFVSHLAIASAVLLLTGCAMDVRVALVQRCGDFLYAG